LDRRFQSRHRIGHTEDSIGCSELKEETMAERNSGVRETWESAAPGWAKWEKEFSAGLFEATETLIDMADVRPGMRVLDLACGAGNQTIQAARRVGPTGRVIASDISATMLEYARRNAAEAGLKNIEFVAYAAEDLDSSQPAVDAAISRLGLMLFLSPGKALSAVRQVLRSGARFAALVFTTPGNNPFMAKSMAILLRHAHKSPPAPGQPGIFALGGEKVLETVIADSGLTDVKSTIVRATLTLASASDALNFLQEAAGVYRAVVADLGAAEKAEAWREVHDFLRQFESDNQFHAQLECKIASGAR
jgi:ubiquinone/menaquinone biosynthesis C-methylase UbiE